MAQQTVPPANTFTDDRLRYGTYPELSWQAVVTGWLLGAVIAVAIGYSALKLGFSIEGSGLAAILGFGVLRGLLGRRSIVENNVAQTVASAVNGASSGIMFSVPAVFILGYGDRFDPLLLTFGCAAGAVLGIAVIVPLRKQMIDFERLTYPGGVAVAAILKSPGAGVRKAALLIGAAAISGITHAASRAAGMSSLALDAALGLPPWSHFTWSASLLTVGVGFIAGRGGIAFVVGGLAVWWLVVPALASTAQLPTDAAGVPIAAPAQLRELLFQPLGIGMLIGGAMTGVVLAAPLILRTIRAMQRAARLESSASSDELPIRMLYLATGCAALLLCAIAVFSVESVGPLRGIGMAVLGTVWIWMSGIVLSEAIGRTNWSPLSGMTLIGVSLMILMTSGLAPGDSVVAAVLVGAATSVAMSQATDLMLDLKTGYLVGASPRKQQIGQFLGAWLGPLVVVSLVFILDRAWGLGTPDLPAPQGQVLAATIEGLLGGDVPLQKYIAGALLGAALSALSGGLGVTVGLGFYLPFATVLTYMLGTAGRVAADRALGPRWSEEVGIPIAAGLVIGEALVGVGYALHAVIAGLALAPGPA